MSPTTGAVSLTLPGGAGWAHVAELVLAGLGARLELPYDRIDELQLAVGAILRHASVGDVRVEVRPFEEALEVQVGPLGEEAAHDPARRRVLDALADAVEVVADAGGPGLVLTFTRGEVG